jgi:hypothetical protein
MKKETYYFSHDYSCTNDPKIQTLIGKYGASGYGIFWRVVEMLHEDQDNRIELKAYVIYGISSLFNEDPEKVKEIINFAVEVCELFEIEEGFIYSNRVLENLNKRQKIKEARSKAGKRSAEIRKQKSTSVEQNSRKESKVKESKVKENKELINYEGLLTFFNNTFSKQNRVINDSIKSKYKARLKEGYTTENIKQSILTAKKDQFHIDSGYKWCTLEYFSRSNTLDKYGFDKPQDQNKKYVPTK